MNKNFIIMTAMSVLTFFCIGFAVASEVVLTYQGYADDNTDGKIIEKTVKSGKLVDAKEYFKEFE